MQTEKRRSWSYSQSKCRRSQRYWQRIARISIAVKEEYDLDYFSEDSHQEDSTSSLNLDPRPPLDQRDNLCSVASEGIEFSKSVVEFQDVKRFEDFKIYMDGLILDSELPLCAKMTYYELCCSRKMYLHDCLVKGLDSKLVTGMISETSKIADAIKSTSITASIHNLECWDTTLEAFEKLGMNVGFLRTRIDKLVQLSREYQNINESKSANFEQVGDRKRALRKKISTMDALLKSIETLKELIKSLEAEIDAVERKNEELGFEFNKIAAAPW